MSNSISNTLHPCLQTTVKSPARIIWNQDLFKSSDRPLSPIHGVVHLYTHAELGLIYVFKLNPPLPLTPGLAVSPRRKGNISQAEHVFTALRHSWRHGWGKGCYWKAYAINHSPEMGLDCMARDHTLQQISRETASWNVLGARQALFWASHRGISSLQATQTQK